MRKDLRRVLFVDDEPDVLTGLKRQLHNTFEVHTAPGGKEAIQLIREEGPFPVVVSDMRMPEMDGSQFLSRVRALSPETERILLTGHADVEAAISAVNDGQIFRYLVKPCSKEVLLEALDEGMQRHDRYLATRRMLASNQELQVLAMEDPLMGIGNRRAMERDLDHTHSGAVRYMRFYSVVLIDVDHFKLYNDHYGHQAGDKVLKKLAMIIKSSIRAADRPFRYGGEELLLLLPETNEEGAQVLAKRLVDGIYDREMPHEACERGVLTISAGVTGFDPRNDTVPDWRALVARADRALYRAKSAGRNCVELPE
jgi:diguanylate cyclase (GGDEF)-like protein